MATPKKKKKDEVVADCDQSNNNQQLEVPDLYLKGIDIKSLIYIIRGQKVMLDSDLAALYGVKTKRLNESVKRNNKRFEGDDFMFRLTKDELNLVLSRSQIVTLKNIDNEDIWIQASRLRSQIATSNNGRGGTRYLPFAFTELGVAMLSSVLTSETAIDINRDIMRAFVAFRHLANKPLPDNNAELRAEIQALRDQMNDILADQNDINETTRAQLDAISTALAELQSERPRQFKRRPIGFNPPKEESVE